MEKNNHYLLTPSRPLDKEIFVTKATQTDHSFAFCRKLNLEDSVSTPPSELRREIFSLRNELSEAHEFHDLELAVLAEENTFKDMELKMNKSVIDLEKRLVDAEKNIDNANKEIIQLKVINQDLSEKLKDESNKNIILNQKYEDEIAKLLQNLKKKKYEIETLEKDKNDSESEIQVLRESYDRKIKELQLALDSANDKITKIEGERDCNCETFKQKLSEEKERISELSKELEDKKIELTLCRQEIMKLEERHLKKNEITLEENKAGEENSCHKSKDIISIEKRIQTDSTVSESHEEHSQQKNLLCAKESQIMEKEINNVSKEVQLRNENFNENNQSINQESDELSEILKGEEEEMENLKNVEKLNDSHENSNQNLANFTTKKLVSYNVDEKSFETSSQEKYLNNILPADKTERIEESLPEIKKNKVQNDMNEYDDENLVHKMNIKNEILSTDTYSNKIASADSSEIFSQNSVVENNGLSFFVQRNDEKSFELHTLDERKMQLNVNSDLKMTEFVNEFASVLLKNDIIDLNELKTCSNIFYSLLNKYLALMQLNSHLKTIFDANRLIDRKEFYNIMVHCLDSLRSQLEESSNLSDSSLVSFKDCPASSTMMDVSEVEMTLVNNITLKANDPLALTNEITCQTPLKNILKSNTKNTSFDFKTPLKSVSKYLRTPLKTPLYSDRKRQISGKSVREMIDGDSAEKKLVEPLGSLAENEKRTFEPNIDIDKKLREAEAFVESTLKSFSLVEARFIKLENLSKTFQTEKEKLTKENEELQELLLKKSIEIEDVKEKLITEIISLNSELQDALSDEPATDILSIFINTVKESCCKIPEILSQQSFKEIEELNVKINDYETKIQESERTIEKLQDLAEELKTEKEALQRDISDQNEEIKKLNLEVLDNHTLKLQVENLKERIREKETILNTETLSKENILKDLEKFKVIYEKVESENVILNKTIKELEKTVTDINVELKVAKERLLNDENKEEELMNEIESLRSAFAEAEKRNHNLQEIIQNYESDIISAKNSQNQKIFEIKLLNEKLMEIKNQGFEKEHVISQMSCSLSELKKNFDSKSQELSDLNIEMKKLNDELIVSDAKCKHFEEEVKEMCEKIVKCEEVNKSLSEELEKATLRADETEVLLALKDETIKRKQFEIESAAQERFICGERISYLREIIETLTSEKREVELSFLACKNLFSDEIKALNSELLDIMQNLNLKNTSFEEEPNEPSGDNTSPLKPEMELLKENMSWLKESILYSYKEREDFLLRNIDVLKSKLSVLESDLNVKILTIAKLKAELEEVKEVKNEEEKATSLLREEMEELRKENHLLETTLTRIEADLERLRASDEEVKKLKIKLTSLEDSLNEKAEITVCMAAKLAQAEESKVSYEKEISALKVEIEELKKVNIIECENNKNRLKIGQNEGEESEIRIADLNEKTEDSYGTDVPKQSNQSLEDDNYLLQQELKKLKEQYNKSAMKSDDIERLGEFHKADTSVPNVKLTKRQPRDKTIRKLEKSEELNESLAEVVMRMLLLTAYENLQQINLISNSGFLSQRNQILNHLENWVHSKAKEVQELKEHIEELDEECESYAKEIIEAKKETVKIWEEGQSNVNTLETQIAQLQEECKSLKSEKEKLQEKINHFKVEIPKMAINKEIAQDKSEMHQQQNEHKALGKVQRSAISTEASTDELEKLNEENTALQLQVLDLKKAIAHSKEEAEKLDEECECYAKVIQESKKETVKVWEEGRVEINKLKLQIKVLQEENNNLKIEKENALKKSHKNCESKRTPYNETENNEPEFVSCHCEKEVKELKSAILLKEIKILEAEQLLEKNVIHKSRISYLENSLANFKKQFAEEQDKNKRLQEELNEFYNGQKENVLHESIVFEKMKTKNFLEPNTVQQIEDRERIQKLEKDNKMLKELCRTRYNEIRKLEKENLSLKGHERITK